MLLKLLKTYLAPYRSALILVIVLQLVQTIASLYLPSLNADIIDNGVTRGNTTYIIEVGAVMLAVSLGQILCAVAAVYFGARAAMGFGRDVRNALFTNVQKFSGQDVATFGAPSLITRTTNDVQQVQMVTMMGLTIMVIAPIMLVGGVIMALQQDAGLKLLTTSGKYFSVHRFTAEADQGIPEAFASALEELSADGTLTALQQQNGLNVQ